MIDTDLALVATADLSGVVRGRAFGAAHLNDRLEQGVGWVPANLAISAFGMLEEPNVFGSIGDLRLQPELSASIDLISPDGEATTKVVLANTVNLDLSPWSCCPRGLLQRALAALEAEFGLTMFSAFEHEFSLLNEDGSQMTLGGAPFSVAALRSIEPFGSQLFAALDDAGFEPDTWLAEFGPNQFEITLAPSIGIVAADRALLLRELVRDLAGHFGWRASFTPLVTPQAIGNGVHVHFSLRTGDGSPVLYDPTKPGRLSDLGGSFAAGVLKHTGAVCALSAPSVVSYLRLRPHTWSAGRAVLGLHNREALLRICPTVGEKNTDRQFNLEFRAADGTANPWLVMASLVIAGLDGLRNSLPSPVIVADDFEKLSDDERDAAGTIEIPDSIEKALAALRDDALFVDWLGEDMLVTYLAIKERESSTFYGSTDQVVCQRYLDVY
jgi:glutamine synthetase